MTHLNIVLQNSTLLKSQNYVDGNWCNALSGKLYAVKNPATGEVIAEVANASDVDARKAIDAAVVAQKKWAKKTAKERSNILRKWFELIALNREDLAKIITAEQGKPLREARAEILYGASFFEWFSEEAKRIYGDVIAPPSDDKRILTFKQPVGVVAAITPWNFPHAMLARKLAPALAAGCAVIVKPAVQTPLSAYALAVLAQEAGVPAGVLNIICGEDAAAIGKEFTSNPAVNKISFTGSTVVGKQLIGQCADTVTKISLELGGNAPFIVFEDADIDNAVAGAVAAKFRNAGQTCVCVNRFYVHSDVYNEFVEKLSQSIQSVVVGNGANEETTIGPLISLQAVAKVQRLVDEAIARGAVKKIGKKLNLESGLDTRLFYPPTLLLDVSADAQLCKEEIFGPVAAIIKFNSDDEVLAWANNSDFGLSAYFYTKNYQRMWRFAEQLEVGMVGINEGIISNEMAPFGGVKQSGWGREGSRYGIDDYLTIKYVCIGDIS